MVFTGARSFLPKWDPLKKPRAVWIRVYLLPKKDLIKYCKTVRKNSTVLVNYITVILIRYMRMSDKDFEGFCNDLKRIIKMYEAQEKRHAARRKSDKVIRFN